MKNHILKLWAKLFAKYQYQRLNNFLFDLSLRGLGILNYQDEFISGEHHFITQILPKYCKTRAPILIDIGANEGGYSKLLFESNPHAQIIAFEPHPTTFKKLTAEFGSTINLQQMALGAQSGTITLFDYSSADGSQHASIYEDVIKEIHHSQAMGHDVELDRLDSVAERLGLSDQITLIKIDTEGNELEVLKGSQLLIQRNQVAIFQIEFNEMNVISRVFMRDIQAILSEYSAFRLLPRGAIRIAQEPLRKELFAFQNIVFIHNKFAPGDDMLPTA